MKRTKDDGSDSEGGSGDENISELMRRNKELTRMKQKRMAEKAEKEVKKAEEMKKWVEEQDRKRKADMDQIINQRQKTLQERHELLQKKRQEREELRQKQQEGKKPTAGNYIYRRMEKDFKERVELPELRRQQEVLEQRRQEIRSVDIGRLQKEGELALLEQKRKQELMRVRQSYSAADASTSTPSPRPFMSRHHEQIERERIERARQEDEREARKREALLRRQQYGKLVRDVFIPSTDERLQNELEDRVRRLDAMKRNALTRLEEGQSNAPRVDLSTIFADRARPGGDTGRSGQSMGSFYGGSYANYEHPYGGRPLVRRGEQKWSP